jgi:hypothetical protein
MCYFFLISFPHNIYYVKKIFVNSSKTIFFKILTPNLFSCKMRLFCFIINYRAYRFARLLKEIKGGYKSKDLNISFLL